LELLDADPGFAFLLDGQSIVVEDYLAIRPHRQADLARHCAAGRVAVGPWWVQPDSFLPSGETHVRNLLEGRRVARLVGTPSKVAYLPDSFGHPAQFPQLFAGFGLAPFVYWRGHGNELADLPVSWSWVAPDGTAVAAHHLRRGYFNASSLRDLSPAEAAAYLSAAADQAGEDLRAPRLLMNGVDHMLPDPNTAQAASALAAALPGATVRRGLLDALLPAPDPAILPSFQGELRGGRAANLLPGVWSARLPLKLAARECEALLTGWAEPWAAVAKLLGDLPDERPALRLAWRSLLENTAHDSIGGCSVDGVHARMTARFSDSQGLASQTTARLLERLCGQPIERWSEYDGGFDIAAVNPAPRPCAAAVVTLPLEGYPIFNRGKGERYLDPLVAAGFAPRGWLVEGAPARLVPATGPDRMQVLTNGHQPYDLEFVVTDLPPLGWRRLRVTPADVPGDTVDAGTDIAAGPVRVSAAADGTLAVRFGGAEHAGLFGLEDTADAGDSYDADVLPDGDRIRTVSVQVVRRRHASGVAHLEVTRVLSVPAALAEPDRSKRTAECVEVTVTLDARVAPGVPRVDVDVRVDNTARDHRLRLLFPLGAREVRAATTFDTAVRDASVPDATGWRHPAPVTFPHQGWISGAGLTVVAPGLPEAQLLADGTLAVTLLRSVGWLSRAGLGTRPEPAGPAIPVEGAQCLGRLAARISLLPTEDGTDPSAAALAAELGVRAVQAGPAPTLPPGVAALEVEPAWLVLSAFKPAEDGGGAVLRLANPTPEPVRARIRLGIPVTRVERIRLDEQPIPGGGMGAPEGGVVQCDVPAHALVSLLLR
ncbi:MAG: glycoside hydrolase family 38 N-terminal domain-containing protein, partial [Mycobacteriales bacterium]